MDLIIYWLKPAENDLDKIYDFYVSRAQKRVAIKIIEGIISEVYRLGKNPYIGQKEVRLAHRPKNFRYLIRENHKIIYWINEEKNWVEIVGVFDCRQNPNKMNVIKEPTPKTYANKNEETR